MKTLLDSNVSRHRLARAQRLLGVALLLLAACSEGKRSRPAGNGPTIDPTDLHSGERDASLPPDEDELDAGHSPPKSPAPEPEDAGPDFVKYWDGSTTPTADNVPHDDSGVPTPPRGDNVDSGAP
jgi:hypothetical protein